MRPGSSSPVERQIRPMLSTDASDSAWTRSTRMTPPWPSAPAAWCWSDAPRRTLDVRLTERILLIGSGEPDWAPTDPLDSQVYLVETLDGHVVVDAGAGASVPAMVEAARRDGVD